MTSSTVLARSPDIGDRRYRQQAREATRAGRLREAGLLSPALVLLILLLAVPVVWLGVISVQADGSLSGSHYQRLVTDPSYTRSALLTLRISGIVTLLAILLGYPVAYLMSQLRPSIAIFLLTCVVVPFWTSVLVRTYAWLVLLQREGVVNKLLVYFGFIDQPIRLAHNEIGVIIGMLHVMLPFLILPLYANMRRIDTSLVVAASSLGASPLYAFWRVYFPLSLPGVVAGGLMVFVLCLGFYITPAVLGGGKTMVVAILIDRNVSLFVEWGAAGALAIAFVSLVLMLFYVLNRIFPIDRLLGGH